MFEKILVAFDGSESSKKALDMSIEIAKKFNSVIHLVSVIAQSDFAAIKNEAASTEESTFYQELQKKVIRSRKCEVEIKPVLIYGHPANRIIEYIQSENFDLMVIGSRGLSGTQRFFLGSVSDELSHHSPCPVLIVR